jgi:hypothetical protein
MALFTHTHTLLIKFGRILSLFLSLTFSGPVHTVSIALFRRVHTVVCLLSLVSSLVALLSRLSRLPSSLRLYIFVQFAMQFGARICY